MGKQFTNSLITQHSPYLLQHAHNPVNWVIWDKQFLEKAAEKQQLLIISIGYSACHWCHVMEAECFENEVVAKFMNQYFISIKVDREERPDVDQFYMEALQLITGGGGWPLNIVALPDGRPLWGCTYLPAEQWMIALEKIVHLQQQDPKKLEAYGDQMLSYLTSEIQNAKEDSKVNFSKEAVIKKLLRNADPYYGGYTPPKFMMPVLLDTLLKFGLWLNNVGTLKQAYTTLNKIALGGIHDVIEGGLSRYATDEKWHVPHFEKMAYDNGLALSTYSAAFRMEQKDLYAEVLYGIVAFVSTWLVNAQGGFASAVDADSENLEGENEEGAYYVWNSSTLKEALGKDFNLFASYFNINSFGKWENRKYVLIRQQDALAFCEAQELSVTVFKKNIEEWKNKLLQLRQLRKPPAIDEKILCSWNAILVQGLLDAYRATGKTTALNLALTNLKYLFSTHVESTGLIQRYVYDTHQKTAGFLEDYAFLIRACIYCYETIFDPLWLSRAQLLVNYCLKHFKKANSPLLYFTAQQHNSLLIRKIDCEDNVLPSSNAVMAENLFRLGTHLNNSSWKLQAKAMVNSMLPQAEEHPKSYSMWIALALELQLKPKELVIVGPKYKAYFKTIHALELPHIRLAGSAKAEDLPLLKNRFQKEKTLIYWCEDNQCKLPTNSLQDVLDRLTG